MNVNDPDHSSSRPQEDFPVPEDEKERLEALRRYDILDSPREPVFDRLTETAAKAFNVPIALLCMVNGDRQWFKSYTGVDFRETERSCAFCNYVLTQKNTTVIPDATEDPRVADNRLVVEEPHVRFYAGAPIQEENGHVLGTLCLLDQEPRSFSEREMDVLELLALECYSQMKLRLKNQLLEDKQIEGEANLTDKRAIIRELNHRVTTNFQLMKSMLSLQKQNARSEQTWRLIDREIALVELLSLIHDELMNLSSSEYIPINAFFTRLIRIIFQRKEGERRPVNIQKELEDDQLHSSTCQALGLILNQLIQNVFDRAEHASSTVDVRIRMNRKNDTFRLSVQDDGPALRDEQDGGPYTDRGMNLIKRLTEEKLFGTFSIESGESEGISRFLLEFPAITKESEEG